MVAGLGHERGGLLAQHRKLAGRPAKCRPLVMARHEAKCPHQWGASLPKGPRHCSDDRSRMAAALDEGGVMRFLRRRHKLSADEMWLGPQRQAATAPPSPPPAPIEKQSKPPSGNEQTDMGKGSPFSGLQ
jgi:hypothetical protein